MDLLKETFNFVIKIVTYNQFLSLFHNFTSKLLTGVKKV